MQALLIQLKLVSYSAISEYRGNFVTKCALQLAPLFFVRPGELRHAERNNIRAAYNYAEYLPERRTMMQWWAEHLDKLGTGAEIIPLMKRIKA